VALVVPTTLLARQHTRNFEERFEGWPIRIGQLSRMVSQRESNAVKEGLKDGRIDLVIGTHALFSKDVQFRDLGLVIIDEEQHFGVAHKEKLKQLRADVHVLTLSATPIPRTLQLALSGARDLSLITTPPVDRLAVRTYVSPFDAVMIREALLREKYRGGQSFLVVPRIKDIRDMEEFLREQVPEITFRTGHGQMPSGELDDIMNGYYDGRYDVLLATTIIESGLDIPSANTMIIHHADQFGLAQLYQLRGRVGRSKVRGYTYLTTSPRKMLTTSAEKRLQILQSLDSLGAGFTLASHDLDLRGAGNLLGDDQSGHIKEVGFELYQSMLEDAVAELSSQDGSTEHSSHQFSPSINLDLSVLIPQNYVADLDLRLSLYRRLGELDDHEMVDQFGAELIDRFGPLPVEVDHLLRVIKLKNSCRQAKIDRIDAGPKGVLLGFFNDQFENPTGLLSFIDQSRGSIRVRPDHRLVITKTWTSPLARLKGLHQIVNELVSIAQQTKG
ncbi:MAG: DEAD/DEAH box helicase, partial [Alphaproteobacteria bacterium]|nr:DEAD/DEAH box helicase [Alphaproteobacteria bacterium]